MLGTIARLYTCAFLPCQGAHGLLRSRGAQDASATWKRPPRPKSAQAGAAQACCGRTLRRRPSAGPSARRRSLARWRAQPSLPHYPLVLETRASTVWQGLVPQLVLLDFAACRLSWGPLQPCLSAKQGLLCVSAF